MIKPVPAAVLLLALCTVSAQAQSVYRCGESYSTQPCPGGTVVPTDDPRSAAQRAQADAATRRDARSAQVLEQERLRLEAKPAPANILASAPGDAPAGDRKAPQARLKKPDVFTAVARRNPAMRRQRRRKSPRLKGRAGPQRQRPPGPARSAAGISATASRGFRHGRDRWGCRRPGKPARIAVRRNGRRIRCSARGRSRRFRRPGRSPDSGIPARRHRN